MGRPPGPGCGNRAPPANTPARPTLLRGCYITRLSVTDNRKNRRLLRIGGGVEASPGVAASPARTSMTMPRSLAGWAMSISFEVGEFDGDGDHRDAEPWGSLMMNVLANDPQGQPSIVFEVSGEPRDLPQPLQAMLLRVAQGALANSREHSCASTAYITLSYLDDEVAIDIVDNGNGFTPGDTKHRSAGSFGLSAMRERAQQVGGTLIVEFRPGAGTAIHAAVPTP